MCVWFFWIITDKEGFSLPKFIGQYYLASNLCYFSIILSNTLSSTIAPKLRSNFSILCFFCGLFFDSIVFAVDVLFREEYIPGCIAGSGWLNANNNFSWTGISQSPSVRFLFPSKMISLFYTAKTTEENNWHMCQFNRVK